MINSEMEVLELTHPSHWLYTAVSLAFELDKMCSMGKRFKKERIKRMKCNYGMQPGDKL